MLTSLAWIRYGAAKAVPIREQDFPSDEEDEDEIEEMEEEESKTNVETTSDGNQDELKEYNLDDYDNEEESVFFDATMNEVPEAIDDEDDLSDIDDYTIRESDALLLGVHTEEDISHLDVYVYEEDDENLYVHHDIVLPSFPLCVEWLDYYPQREGEQNVGSLAAVGTFEPAIEIWDLDILNTVAPVLTLGGEEGSKPTAKPKKAKSKSKLVQGSHESGVLGLAWNKQGRNFLASCSADKTIKLWDMSKGTCLLTLTNHKDKVQSIQWHPVDATVLLSGSFDKTVSIVDVRYSQAAKSCTIDSDVECLRWNTHTPEQFMTSLENGTVLCHDIRSLDKPLWTLSAHSKPTSSLSYNTLIPNFLATGSTDKTIKLWNIAGNQPVCLHTIRTSFPIFTMGFYPSERSPFMLAGGGQSINDNSAIGGENPEERLNIWNTSTFEAVANVFRKS